MKKIKINEKDIGKRLDKFLTEQMPDLSRSQIQKKIRSGFILINSEKTSVHHFLKEKDVITINNQQIATNNKKNNNLFKKIKIIKETKNYLIIEKPAGLVVHPALGLNEKTLIEYLLEKYPEIEKVEKGASLWAGTERPGIVHRLDRDVSGLMVIAKTLKIFASLKKQFQERKIKKTYQALVYGPVAKDEGVIETPLQTQRGKTKARTDTQKDESEVRDAVTEYSVNQRWQNYTLLDVNIKTGRTHQIRAHLLSIGHPVVGDAVYKSGSNSSTAVNRFKRDREALGRIFLHAHVLGFYELNNDWCEFESELPIRLKGFLKGLK